MESVTRAANADMAGSIDDSRSELFSIGWVRAYRTVAFSDMCCSGAEFKLTHYQDLGQCLKSALMGISSEPETIGA